MRKHAEFNQLVNDAQKRIQLLLKEKGQMKPVNIYAELFIDGSVGRTALGKMKHLGLVESTGRYYRICGDGHSKNTTKKIRNSRAPSKELVHDPSKDRRLELVQVKNGTLVTTSLIVAEVFGKDHSNVLKAIENLDCSQQFREVNFNFSNYLTSQGKNLPYVEMTRDGFMFLVMGFTGAEAARWKENFIKAFNDMENTIKESSAFFKELIAKVVDLQGQQQAAMANGFFAMNTRIDVVDTKVDRLNHEVTGLAIEVRQLSNRGRRNIKQSVKDEIRRHVQLLGGKCPCCSINTIVNSDGNIVNAEYDHNFSNQHADADHVWLICKPCHLLFTTGKVARVDRQHEFNAFQKQRSRLPRVQSELWK